MVIYFKIFFYNLWLSRSLNGWYLSYDWWLQIQDIYDEAGILGFWKGVFPALIMASVSLFLSFTHLSLSLSLPRFYFRSMSFLGYPLYQVWNPSIQFMLYETLLKKLRARRAARGSTAVSALEVLLTVFLVTMICWLWHIIERFMLLKSWWVTCSQFFLLGATAKLGATVATYPLLVVKVVTAVSLPC